MIPYQPQLLTVDDGQWTPNAELAPNCPRCDSSNNKFCYYNNYSLSQPPYFCKTCRRYWTKGGALRNVPVGGGCPKKRKLAKSQRPGTANTRQIAHGQPLNSLRPDLILDGMALGHHPSSSASDLSASDVSGIDMAELYAKYMNPTTGKRDSFVAETLVTTDQQEDLSAGELDLLALPLMVDGVHGTDHFFVSSNCTADKAADKALTWPGPGEEFGIVDSLILYQNVIDSDCDNCSQFSSLDAMHPA